MPVFVSTVTSSWSTALSRAVEGLAHISPYLTEHIRRFGQYSTHELGIHAEAYDPHLDVDFSPLRGDGQPETTGYDQAA
ncbi:hypothetical protein [Streptomyces cinereoruber]|uniref:hypothetical protein n=1 Tax=Streptomyces cinereoruber TaxID=67260 RepID=UPI003C30425A